MEDELLPMSNGEDYTEKVFYTKHFGRCKTIEVHTKLWGRQYIVFETKHNDLKDIVLIMLEKGEEVYSILGEFPRRTSATYMDGRGQVVLITPKNTTSLSRPQHPCKHYHAQEEFLKCKAFHVAKSVKESGFDCLPFWVWNVYRDIALFQNFSGR